MNDPHIQKNISEMINHYLASRVNKGKKLLQMHLEQHYKLEDINFKQQISHEGKLLTKRILATNVKCLENRVIKDLPSHSNLKALSYIFIFNCFQDEHIMEIMLQKIQAVQEASNKFLHFPYSELEVKKEDLSELVCDILKRFNDWRRTFSISDILSNYYVAIDIISLYLQAILIALGFPEVADCQIPILETSNIFAILSDYFDLNMIHRSSDSIKLTKQSKNQYLFVKKQTTIYFFQDINLFISTYDGHEFCVGKYYNTEKDLFHAEPIVRKSTLQYFLEKKEALERQNANNKKNQSQIKMSQIQMDLGTSTSGIINQGENSSDSSNFPTPQFGKLMDSLRFKRSHDFTEGVLEHGHPQQRAKQLKTVKEQLQHSINTNTNRSMQLNCTKKQSFLFQEQKNKQLHQNQYEKEDTERNRIPKSPASRERNDRRLLISQSRQISMISSQSQHFLNFQSLGKNKRNQNNKPCQSQRDNEIDKRKNNEQHNKGTKTQVPKHNNKYSLLSSMKFQEISSYQNNNEHNILLNQTKSPKKSHYLTPKQPQNNSRKYSVNESSQDKLRSYKSGKKSIYNSNHLYYQNMAKSTKFKGDSQNFQNQMKSFSEIGANSSKKVMSFASNTVNLKMNGGKEKNVDEKNKQVLEASYQYLVISREPGQGGFKKKKKVQNQDRKYSPNQSKIKSKSPHNRKQFRKSIDRQSIKKDKSFPKQEKSFDHKGYFNNNLKNCLTTSSKYVPYQKNMPIQKVYKYQKIAEKHFYSPPATNKFPEFLRIKNIPNSPKNMKIVSNLPSHKKQKSFDNLSFSKSKFSPETKGVNDKNNEVKVSYETARGLKPEKGNNLTPNKNFHSYPNLSPSRSSRLVIEPPKMMQNKMLSPQHLQHQQYSQHPQYPRPVRYKVQGQGCFENIQKSDSRAEVPINDLKIFSNQNSRNIYATQSSSPIHPTINQKVMLPKKYT